MSSWNSIGNFRGLKGDTGSPGVSFIFRGTWVSTTAYAINDVVTRLGSTYIYTVANTGSDPATDGGVNCVLMAQGGAAGGKGEVGDAGPVGPRGSKFQPSVAPGALPAIDGTIVMIGDMIFTTDGTLYQVIA